MSNLEETKEFLKKHCLQKCNHNSNESCICKVAICFKEIEKTLIELEKLREFDRFCSMGKSSQYCKNEVIK